jgi:hypothetical protein
MLDLSMAFVCMLSGFGGGAVTGFMAGHTKGWFKGYDHAWTVFGRKR